MDLQLLYAFAISHSEKCELNLSYKAHVPGIGKAT